MSREVVPAPVAPTCQSEVRRTRVVRHDDETTSRPEKPTCGLQQLQWIRHVLDHHDHQALRRRSPSGARASPRHPGGRSDRDRVLHRPRGRRCRLPQSPSSAKPNSRTRSRWNPSPQPMSRMRAARGKVPQSGHDAPALELAPGSVDQAELRGVEVIRVVVVRVDPRKLLVHRAGVEVDDVTVWQRTTRNSSGLVWYSKSRPPPTGSPRTCRIGSRTWVAAGVQTHLVHWPRALRHQASLRACSESTPRRRPWRRVSPESAGRLTHHRRLVATCVGRHPLGQLRAAPGRRRRS